MTHVVIDGSIGSTQRPVPADKPDSLLDPDAIAQSYVDLLQQQRSAWTWEIEVRPWVRKILSVPDATAQYRVSRQPLRRWGRRCEND